MSKIVPTLAQYHTCRKQYISLHSDCNATKDWRALVLEFLNGPTTNIDYNLQLAYIQTVPLCQLNGWKGIAQLRYGRSRCLHTPEKHFGFPQMYRICFEQSMSFTIGESSGTKVPLIGSCGLAQNFPIPACAACIYYAWGSRHATVPGTLQRSCDIL